MGFIGDLLGTSSNKQAVKGTTGDIEGANNGVNTSFQQQQAFNQALAAQNGLGTQQSAISALQGLGGQQQALAGQQQGLVGQLQGVANGTGPNPAQAMLAQATGSNVSNQAALMAGQRGAGANAGLIARQAGQQGAATQQQAAGQAATMQANQSLNALGQIGQQQANIGQTYNNAAGYAGQIGAIGTNQVGQQAAGLNASSNIAAGNQGVQAGLANANNQQQVQQAMANASNNQKTVGGIIQGAGSAAAMMASGGAVPRADIYTPGGPSDTGFDSTGVPGGPADSGIFASQLPVEAKGPKSSFGKQLGAGASGLGKGMEASSSTPTLKVEPLMKFAHGGKVPAMVSPGERYLPPNEVKKVAQGKKEAIKAGEKIPGKAKVKGDSLKNDTVPKTLQEGGIVLPKSVMESKNPHWAAHRFVSAIVKSKGLK